MWAQGEQLERSGDRAAALQVYFEAMQAGEAPQTALTMLRHAEFLEARGDPGAEAAFMKLADVTEPRVRAAAWRGIASYRLARGATAAGLAALEVVVATGVADESARAWRNIGAIREDLGDREAARAACPGEAAVASYFLGLCEVRLGNGPAATAALRRTAELGSGEVQAEARRLLAGLR